MTTALFLLRCVDLGLSMEDLDLLTIGMITEMFYEKQRDGDHYDTLASQEDFDLF